MALITCPECQNEISDRATNCPKCGCPINASIQLPPTPPPNPQFQQQMQATQGGTSRGIYILIALFLGIFGIHNFYAGRIGPGVAQLLITLIFGWFIIGLIVTGIWAIVDIVAVKTDGSGRLMT